MRQIAAKISDLPAPLGVCKVSATLAAVVEEDTMGGTSWSRSISRDAEGIVYIDEESVISALKDIIQNSGDYSMRAFNRKVMSHKVRKTSETTHSFYVITRADGTFNTLSFSPTGKLPTSKGAWAMDTEGDITSYTDYLNNNNRWEIEEIKTDKGINTPLTLNKVLSKARSGIKYFFHAKVNKNDNYDNCNTAVLETLIENVN